jgi:hypothetical protein
MLSRSKAAWSACASLVLLVCTACGSNEQATASTPDTETNVSFVGDWSGLIGCRGRDFPIDIAIRDSGGSGLSAAVTIAPALSHARVASPWNRAVDGAPFAVTADDGLRLISLVEEGGGRRGIRLDVMASDDAAQAVLASTDCEHGVLFGGTNAAAALAELRAEFAAIREPLVITQDDQAKACPDHLRRWIDVGMAAPLDDWGRGDATSLWKDDTTTQVFGKPLDRLSAEERRAARLALTASCGERGNRKQLAIINLLSRITDERSFRAQHYDRVKRAVVNEWVRHVDGMLAADAPLNGDAASAAMRAPLRFDFVALGPLDNGEVFDGQAFAERLKPALDAAHARAHEASFLDLMASRAGRFRELVANYEDARRDERIADDKARAIFEANIVAAAESFAAAADDLRNAAEMRDWIAGVDAGLACGRPPSAACTRARGVFDDRLTRLASEFAARLTDELGQFDDTPPSLDLLSHTVERGRAIDAQYAGLFDYGKLGAAKAAWDRKRWSLQDRLARQIREEFEPLALSSEITRLRQAYYSGTDLDRRKARPVAALISEKMRDTTPFNGTGADDYLNALYNQDFPTLAALDQQATAGLRPTFAFLARQIAAYDAIADAMLGRPTGVFAPIVGELMNPSAVTPVAMTYLLAFEEAFPDCLGADAVTFSFSERTDTVKRNAFGTELYRIQGVTITEHYRVKRELAPLFREVFSKPDDSGVGTAFDRMFNDGGITRLTGGVRTMMKSADCQSPEIARLESGLRAYYGNRRDAWSRRSR